MTQEFDRAKEAKKVTWVGFFVNLGLSVGKIIAGYVGRSGAMIADGVHSLSDFVTDLIVIIFIGVSTKAEDEDHQYGHGKYETFATLLICVALIAVGLLILYNGIDKIVMSLKGETILQPSYIALIAAFVSIISKEALYHYTKNVGNKIKSDAVIANAWHHRSDAFSSIGTLLGISGAMFLSEKWRILDPIASIIVSIFICLTGIKLMIPALKELLDHSLPEDMEKDICQTINNTDGVVTMHHLKTRKNGNSLIIDVHIMVNREISIVIAHNIATDVERRLRAQYPKNKVLTNIHVEPEDDIEDVI